MILKPLGHEQLASIVDEALTVPTGAQRVHLVASVQSVRFRDDGTNPTASVGIKITAGAARPFLYRGDLDAFRMTQVSLGAIVDATYYA